MAIAAMTVDGKIADYTGSAARFPSAQDKAHLERLIAQMDGVLLGANTLRAYGTSLPIRDRHLLEQRQDQQRPPQPTHFVCSRSGNIPRDLPFFQQPIPRGLVTAQENILQWEGFAGFGQVLPLDPMGSWRSPLERLWHQGFKTLGLLGGGELIASFGEQGFLDELYLTICPILLGGAAAPTPMGGKGLLQTVGLQLELLDHQAIASELFLHYRVRR